MLSRTVPGVVQVPQLGPLRSGVPLAELVPQREDPFLGPRLLLVPPAPAEDGVVAILLEHPEKGERLQSVAGGARHGLLDDRSAVDVLLHRADDEANVELRNLVVAVIDHLGKVVPRVDVHDREGDALRPAGLRGEVEEHGRVLAPGEKQRGTLEFGDHLTNNVDRLGREGIEVREPVGHRTGARLAIIRPAPHTFGPRGAGGADAVRRGPAAACRPTGSPPRAARRLGEAGPRARSPRRAGPRSEGRQEPSGAAARPPAGRSR